MEALPTDCNTLAECNEHWNSITTNLGYLLLPTPRQYRELKEDPRGSHNQSSKKEFCGDEEMDAYNRHDRYHRFHGWADLNLANRWNFRPQCDQAQDCDRSACIDPSCDGCDTQTCCDGCGRYLSLFGGWSHVLSYRGADSVVERQGDFSDGFLLGTAFGKQIGCHLRAEAEFAYRFNQADQWSSTPFNNQRVPQQWDGDLNVFSGMTNLVYDFGNRNCNKITPYVGGGIGVAILDGDFSTNATQFEIDDTVFAYQGFAGALFHTGRLLRTLRGIPILRNNANGARWQFDSARTV